jgi:hypothetical protein
LRHSLRHASTCCCSHDVRFGMRVSCLLLWTLVMPVERHAVSNVRYCDTLPSWCLGLPSWCLGLGDNLCVYILPHFMYGILTSEIKTVHK